MKKISIDGRIGRDAELKTTENGRQYVRFSLAVNSMEHGNEITEWFDITTYNDSFIEKIKAGKNSLLKGRYLLVEGRFRNDVKVKDGKIYLNNYVTATDIHFLSSGDKKKTEETKVESAEPQVSVFSNSTPSPAQETAPSFVASVPTTPSAPMTNVVIEDADDDLPF